MRKRRRRPLACNQARHEGGGERQHAEDDPAMADRTPCITNAVKPRKPTNSIGLYASLALQQAFDAGSRSSANVTAAEIRARKARAKVMNHSEKSTCCSPVH
jgi:outer membrane protein TolC